MIDRRHPRDLYDLFRFATASPDHDLTRRLAVLISGTMARDFSRTTKGVSITKHGFEIISALQSFSIHRRASARGKNAGAKHKNLNRTHWGLSGFA